MTGTGTLIDEMMNRVGLVNLANILGKPPLSQLSLEEMVAAKPDFLIVESATDTITDQGSEMLHHPALKNIPRIRVPEAWTVCGSPDYTVAARSIVRTDSVCAESAPARSMTGASVEMASSMGGKAKDYSILSKTLTL